MEHLPAGQLEPTTPSAPPATGAGETFVVVLLIVLTALMIPPWAESGTEYVPDFLGQMFNPWLLPALGLLWVVRCGGLDLSVWIGFGLGSVVAGSIANAGGNPALVLAGVIAAGLVLGSVNAAAVVAGRLPTWGATGITAVVGLSVVARLAGGLPARLEGASLLSWSGPTGPLFLAGAAYIIALLSAVLGWRLWTRAALSDRAALAAALAGSGVLSAMGGLCWVAKSGQLPRQLFLIEDLRVVAAVALAGAVALRGPGRGLLTAVLLPPAMLLATIWRQWVWDVAAVGFAVNLLVLTGTVLGAQWAIAQAAGTENNRPQRRAAMAMFLGIIALAATARELPRGARTVLRVAGAGAWLVGLAAALLLSWRRRRGRS